MRGIYQFKALGFPFGKITRFLSGAWPRPDNILKTRQYYEKMWDIMQRHDKKQCLTSPAIVSSRTVLAGFMAIGLSLGLAACGGGGKKDGGKTNEDEAAAEKSGRPSLDPYPSTYKPYSSEATLITGATILTGTGERIENGSILLTDGKIMSVGAAGDIKAPKDVRTVDADGKWVTPGIIDIHSHLGVYPSPGTQSTSDGNEATSPNTAEVWAEHSVWPHDPGFTRALAGGITSLQILPGSANLFGGRTVTLKNVPSRTVQGMKFPGAPHGLKMACGENPKRVYQSRGPATRMANFSHYRKAWIDAVAYAIESYKVADYLAENDVCAAVWADWWGFKLEAYDTVGENAALVHAQENGCTIIHSDSEIGIQRLNQEAAKAMASGQRIGLDIKEEDAIAWITANPAKVMKVLDETGTLEAGKMADVVVWSRNPFSVYAQAEQVFIDGALMYDRNDPARSPRTDFEIGQYENGHTGGAGQ